jgi:hypothetical protein
MLGEHQLHHQLHHQLLAMQALIMGGLRIAWFFCHRLPPSWQRQSDWGLLLYLISALSPPYLRLISASWSDHHQRTMV